MVIHIWDGNPKMIGTVRSSWPRIIYIKNRKKKKEKRKESEIKTKTLEILSRAKALI